MSDFDERSGVVYCKTPWGQWAQTIEEVFIEVQAGTKIKAKDIKCLIKPRTLSVTIKDEEIIKGNLTGTVRVDESIWTLEDQSLLRIVLIKSRRDASNCWKSLLESQYESNFWELDQTEKKLTLERFQNENPGFDFSGADITGNYQGGGPQLK